MPLDPWDDFPDATPSPRSAPAADPWADFPDAAAAPQGSAVGRFAAGAGRYLNPITMLTGIESAIAHPVDTFNAARQDMAAQQAKADEVRAGMPQTAEGVFADYPAYLRQAIEYNGRAAAAHIPFIGPAAAQAADKIAGGDVAGGLGEGAGLVATAFIPSAMREGVSRLKPVLRAAGAPEALEAGSASRVADVMSPKVGRNKVRLGNDAARVAPDIAKDLAKEGAPLTREGFHSQVQSKLADAEVALDAASDARLATRSFSARDILKGLEEKRAMLTSKAVGRGTSTVPAPNAARVAMIDKAIAEVKAVRGPMVTYENMRTIRQAYDGPAKTVYHPAMTADYLTARGGALGAADVTGVLRDQLAKWDPETHAANAQYSLYRTANDVLKATAEVERTRPKVGRQIAARLAGTLMGGSAGGPVGAVAGYVGGPILDSALASGVTTQLKTAALMQRLAEAIRKADVGAVHSITHEIQKLGVAAAAPAGRAVTMDRTDFSPLMLPAGATP